MVMMMIYRSGRSIVVMVMNLVFVVPISVSTMMPAVVVVCQRNASAHKNQKSCN